MALVAMAHRRRALLVLPEVRASLSLLPCLLQITALLVVAVVAVAVAAALTMATGTAVVAVAVERLMRLVVLVDLAQGRVQVHLARAALPL